MSYQGLIGALLFAGVLCGAEAETLSLDDAVNEALAHGADQAVWSANLAASRATEAAARARAGFTVSLNGGYSGAQTKSDPTKDSDDALPQTATAGLTAGFPQTTFSVKGTRKLSTDTAGTQVISDEANATLSQVLWNGYWGGSTQAAADKAALALRSAELTAQSNKNKLTVTVKQAFFTLLSTQESLTQLTQAQAQRAEALKFAQTKATLGQATQLDLKQAQINARTADLDLTAGRSAWEAAQHRLANLLGRAEATGLTAAATPDPAVPAASLEDAVALALKQRIEPQVFQYSARSAQIDAAQAFGSATPTVTVTAGATLTQNKSPTETSALVATLGVTLGTPLWDGGLSSAQGAQANAQKTAAQQQYQQSLSSIPVDVTEAWNNWKVATGRVEVATLAAEVADGQRLVAKTQFDSGLKTLSDLQTADVNLSAAQLALLKAKITAQLSALTLQSLMGQ